MIKSLIRLYLRPFLLVCLGYMLSLYAKLVYKTSKVSILRNEETDQLKDQAKNAIYAFWHSRILMIPILDAPHTKMQVLSSKNDIHYMTDRFVGQFGISPIYGSRQNPNKPHIDKGGSQALKQIIRSLKSGHSIGITPDGPLGPRQKIHHGIIMAAILSQKPIIPITYVGSRGYIAKSWDRFFIPFPFSKLYYKLGQPIYIPKDTSEENVEYYRQKLEDTMNEDLTLLTDQAA